MAKAVKRARKPKHLPSPYDVIHDPPKLPEANTLRRLDIGLSEDEINLVRAAMAVYAASRRPRMTWPAWKMIGQAQGIAEKRIRARAALNYNFAMTAFNRATGFSFLNKGVRWALRQCMRRVGDIDLWLKLRRDAGSRMEARLANPQDIWKGFCEWEANEGKEQLKRPRVRRRSEGEHEHANLIDYAIVLEEQIEKLKDEIRELKRTLAELQGKND